jgi:hypothetical protein
MLNPDEYNRQLFQPSEPSVLSTYQWNGMCDTCGSLTAFGLVLYDPRQAHKFKIINYSESTFV